LVTLCTLCVCVCVCVCVCRWVGLGKGGCKTRYGCQKQNVEDVRRFSCNTYLAYIMWNCKCIAMLEDFQTYIKNKCSWQLRCRIHCSPLICLWLVTKWTETICSVSHCSNKFLTQISLPEYVYVLLNSVSIIISKGLWIF